MRTRLAAVLTAAALLVVTGSATAAEPVPVKPIVSKTFDVADLVVPIPDFGDDPGPINARRQREAVAEGADRLIKQVTGMVRPYSWDALGGAGKAEFFGIGLALVVTNTPDVIAEVADLLEALRRLQDVSVVTEVRVVTVPAGFCDRVGVKRDGGAALTEREVKLFIEAAQGHRETNVTQFPRVTSYDGQTATIRAGERRNYLTRVEAVKVHGTAVLVPKETAVELGDTLTLRGRVSADRKFVGLDAKLTRIEEKGKVEHVPLTTFVTPVFEGGSKGQPIPFTQFLEVPDLKTRSAEKTVAVPDGGTVVIGGWTEAAEAKFGPPVLSKIPYINRMYQNAGPAAEREVIVLATARVVRTDAECRTAAPAPREARR